MYKARSAKKRCSRTERNPPSGLVGASSEALQSMLFQLIGDSRTRHAKVSLNQIAATGRSSSMNKGTKTHGVSQHSGYLFGGPYTRDSKILGSILGSYILGNYHTPYHTTVVSICFSIIVYYSSFHFLFHYPNITPTYTPLYSARSPTIIFNPKVALPLCFAPRHGSPSKSCHLHRHAAHNDTPNSVLRVSVLTCPRHMP